MVNPTLEQQEAIELAKKGESIRLIAFAGAGKTATLKLIAQALAPKKGLYMAFNKSIAQEAQSKMPASVTAKTFHSQALGYCPIQLKQRMHKEAVSIKEEAKIIGANEDEFPQFIEYLGKIKHIDEHDPYVKSLDEEERKKLLAKGILLDNVVGCERASVIELRQPLSVSEDSEGQHFKYIRYKTFTLIQIIRECLISFLSSCDEDITRQTIARFLCARFDIPLDAYDYNDGAWELREKLFKCTTNLINYYLSTHNGVPTTIFHSLYLKLWQLSKPVLDYDFILYDEAQDADPLMIDILQYQIANGIQVIIVGDPHQQIYEWRGAVNAMQSMDLPSVYLTKSFRFGEKIAESADLVLKKLLDEKNTLSSGRADIESKTLWVDGLCQRAFDEGDDATSTHEPDLLETMVMNDLMSKYGVKVERNAEHLDPHTILKHTGAILCLTNMSCFEYALVCHSMKIPFKLMVDSSEMLRLLQDVHKLQIGEQVENRIFRENSIYKWDDLIKYTEESVLKSPELAGAVKLIKKYSYRELVQAIEGNRDNKTGVTICTVHKSKGLEWEIVMFSDDIAKAMLREFHLFCQDPKQAKTELFRTYYVAITRPQRVSIMSGMFRFLIGLISGEIHHHDFVKAYDNYLETVRATIRFKKIEEALEKKSREQKAIESMRKINETSWVFGKQ